MMASHTPLLDKAKKQGKMPLHILSPIPSPSSTDTYLNNLLCMARRIELL